MAEDINAPPKKVDLRFDEWLFRFWAKYQGVQVLANLLSALGNGIIAKTGTGAFSARSITGTTNQITVTNGDGVAGNPVVSLPSAIITPGSLTTTTDLTVNGDTTLGNASTDTTTVNSTLRVAVSGTGLQGFLLDGTKSGADTFKINPTVSGSGGIGFLQGIHNTSTASSGAYQFLPVVTGNSNLNGYSGTLFRLDSDTGLVGPTTSVSTISISGIGPTFWQGSVPSSYRQISVGNVSIASTLIAGISSSITAGTGKWNFYAEGTAQNYFAGNTAYGNTNLQSVFFNTAGVTPRLQVIGTDSATSGILSYRASNNNASAYIALAKSRGASVGTNTIVQNNDQLGRVSFLGADGTNYISAGWIQGEVDDTPGTGDMPGRLVFYTTPDGANLPTEKMRLDNAGRLGIGTTPTAKLHLSAGSATASTAPLKFNSGTILTSPESGVMEYNGRHYQTKENSIRYSMGGTLFDFFTSVGNSGTTETDLYSSTLAANTFTTNGDKIEATYGGTFVSSATATRQIKVYFAGTVILDTGALSISASASWQVNVLLIRVSSTVVRYTISLQTAGASLAVYNATSELTGLTLSNTNILKITGTAAGVGAATNDIVAMLGTVGIKSAI
jgi:hypothetical protein